ncbi:hypothetical protein IAD21_00050 [Abditibacteriota bacterium]|nr:hypothetical protein IAD21_00050 [Abditibacteriota bacterium]
MNEQSPFTSVLGNSKAIVTLAIGARFRERWNTQCRANWEMYAKRHGYDLICLEHPLDDSERACKRSPAWQKCLILSQEFSSRYERIVWIDSDILINPESPDVAGAVPLEKIGAVDEYTIPTPQLHRQILRKLYSYWEAEGIPFIDNETPQDYYALYGLPSTFEQVVQTGMMVLSPRYHRQLLEDTYNSYEETKSPEWNYEMRPLSYEILKAGAIYWLDARFNFIWGIYKALYFPFLFAHPDHRRAQECLTRAFERVYFLHFAGSSHEMPLLREVIAQSPPSILPILHEPQRTTIQTHPAEWKLKTPVVLAVFARPDTTAQVMETIRQAQPPKLLIIADGPRPERDGEDESCARTRAIAESVDWECELLTNYSDVNLGLKMRLQSGLKWVFEQVEEAIILEDDCVPHPSFFRFCEEMLERYRDTPQVMTISGGNFQFGEKTTESSYGFSRYPLIWGWATWRRAWQFYEPDMQSWPALRSASWLEGIVDRQAANYWSYIFQKAYEGLNTWDYALTFSCWKQEMLNVHPAQNLVSNIGFRSDATHPDNGIGYQYSHMLTEAMQFPLQHPDKITRDEMADEFTEEVLFSGNLKRLFKNLRTRTRINH